MSEESDVVWRDLSPMWAALKSLGAIVAVGLAVGCGEQSSSAVALGQSGNELYVLSTAIWNSPHIPVCWETAGYDTEKGWVRNALRTTWEAETKVTFEGWGTCSSSTSSGIRIRTADIWPATAGLGRRLNNLKNGMGLNFWFTFTATDNSGKVYRPFGSCIDEDRENCIRAIAVHEFGHALGFAHEQNRPDTPSTCTQPKQGGNGDTLEGPWDVMSVMNYCNPEWNNDGHLSAADIAGAQAFYGARWAGGELGGAAKKIVAAQNQDGRIEVFYVGADDQIYHRWQTDPNAGWVDEASLGGAAKQIAAASNQDGRIEVFYVGTSGRLFHNWQTDPNGGWNGEAAFGGAAKRIVTAQNQDGRIEVFYVGADDQIYHRWQTDPNAGWVDEASLGGAAKQIATASNQDGRIEVFYIGIDGQLFHNWQTAPNGGWNGEATFGGAAKQIVAARNQDGRIEVFYVGADDQIYHRWQTAPNAGWGDEARLGGAAKQIATASNQDGRIEVFYVGTNGRLFHNWQTDPNGGWSGEVEFGGAAKQIVTAQNQDGRIEVFYVGADDRIFHKWQTAANGG